MIKSSNLDTKDLAAFLRPPPGQKAKENCPRPLNTFESSNSRSNRLLIKSRLETLTNGHNNLASSTALNSCQTYLSSNNSVSASGCLLHDNIVYKNMKLTSMIENISGFASCLTDTKWIFEQGYELMRNFIMEAEEYFEDKTMKRIKVDNLVKEYLRLKKRFDEVDLAKVGQIVQMYIGDSRLEVNKSKVDLEESQCDTFDDRSRAKRNSLNIQNQSLNKSGQLYRESNQAAMPPEPRKHHSNHSSMSKINKIMNSSQQLGKGIEEQQVQEQLHTLRDKTVRLEALNQEQSRRFSELINSVSDLKAENEKLRNILFYKQENEISVVDKLKMEIKKAKESLACSCGGVSLDADTRFRYLDSVILNLSHFQNRLKSDMAQLLNNETGASLPGKGIEALEEKKQQLLGSINAMILELDNLKEEKTMVDRYIGELEKVYNQRRKKMEVLEDEFKQNTSLMGTQNSLPLFGGSQDTEYLNMMLAQATAIEDFLRIHLN